MKSNEKTGNLIDLLMSEWLSDIIDNEREFLDKMFDRLEDKYGEYLWK